MPNPIKQLLKRHPLYKRYWLLRRFRTRPSWRMANLLPNACWVDKLDVILTTRCNLGCKGCNHLMPYYEHPRDVDLEAILKSIRSLSATVDTFDHFNLIGGEPLLYPQLAEVLDAVPYEKCERVQILTNGLVLPRDPALIKAMQRNNLRVVLSVYPKNPPQHIRELLDLLEKHGINYGLYSPPWTDYGPPIDHHPTPHDLQRQFSRCPITCHTLVGNRLYYCFRSPALIDIGVQEDGFESYVDVHALPPKELRKALRSLIWRTKPLETCRYCLRGTDANVKINRGDAE